MNLLLADSKAVTHDHPALRNWEMHTIGTGGTGNQAVGMCRVQKKGISYD